MERRKTYREKRQADPDLALNNKIETLFYEMAAHAILKSGMTRDTPASDLTDEYKREVSERLAAAVDDIRSDIEPLLKAVGQEARALGMNEDQVRKAVDSQILRTMKNLNARRLRDAVSRIEKGVAIPSAVRRAIPTITCPLCLDPDDDARPVVREFFDAMGCGSPNCDHDHAHLYLDQECHPKAGFGAEYCKQHGTITLACRECGEIASCFQVASDRQTIDYIHTV